jgi:hypothetical protein
MKSSQPVVAIPVVSKTSNSGGRAISGCLGLLALSAASLAAHAQGNLPPVNSPTARLAAISAASATTTPRAALVQIIDDQAHAAYQEGAFSGCTIAGVCTASFSAVPAGRRRLIENISCSVYAAAPGSLRYVAFLANSFTAPRMFLPITRSPADSGQYFVNGPALFSFAAGEMPLIYAFADGTPIQDLTCTIFGREISAP